MSFVLMIRERRSSWAGRGPIATSHSNAEEAELVDYVQENWDAKMDEDPPDDDDDELIEMYFEQALEEYVIAETG